MSATYGHHYKVTIFGESHSKAIGVVLDGIPAGFAVDMEAVALSMRRRMPNRSVASTKRQEADEPQIMSGFFEGKATGTPLCAVIENGDCRSQDYERTKMFLRPSHADYTGWVKYKGANDYRGGGHFSGRLTAPLVFAGAIARQVLAQQGIEIGAYITQIGNAREQEQPTKEAVLAVEQKSFYTLSDAAAGAMQCEIQAAHNQADSVGGVVCCTVYGLPVGLGEPFFDSVESAMAHMMFSVPAVKGIEFGTGFGLAQMRGSAANDCPTLDGEAIRFATNHNGGALGGITNGMPLEFRVAFKPTASIGQEQKTVNMEAIQEEAFVIHGRHDACVVPRAVEVVKSAAAIVLLNLWMEANV